MVSHQARLKPPKDVMIRQNTIAFTKSTIFLGIIIGDKLKWTEHIHYVKNIISKSSGILFKVRNYLDKNTVKQLYSFVYPYLIYGIEIWGNASIFVPWRSGKRPRLRARRVKVRFSLRAIVSSLENLNVTIRAIN